MIKIIFFFFKTKLVIWDLRKFGDLRQPVALIEERKKIKQFQFCPAKSSRIGVLPENSHSVNVYWLEERDETFYKHTFLSPASILPTQSLNRVVTQDIKYSMSSTITSFSWHSKDSNRLMVSTSSPFHAILDLSVTDFNLVVIFSWIINIKVSLINFLTPFVMPGVLERK